MQLLRVLSTTQPAVAYSDTEDSAAASSRINPFDVKTWPNDVVSHQQFSLHLQASFQTLTGHAHRVHLRVIDELLQGLREIVPHSSAATSVANAANILINELVIAKHGLKPKEAEGVRVKYMHPDQGIELWVSEALAKRSEGRGGRGGGGGGRGGRGGGKKCFTCGSTDHIAARCPNGGGGSQAQRALKQG